MPNPYPRNSRKTLSPYKKCKECNRTFSNDSSFLDHLPCGKIPLEVNKFRVTEFTKALPVESKAYAMR
jgi:hypothetical protein